MIKDNLNYRINNQIRSQSLRVIDSNGKQIAVMSLSEALKYSQDKNLDLIEIAPNANPPVAKVMELGKFKYEEEKKLKKQKKGSKPSELKEIRFTPFIGEADYLTRFERINEFLSVGDKVKLVVKFGMREMNSKEFGYKIIDRIMQSLGETVNVDMQPKFIGRYLTSIISPSNKHKK